MSKQARTSVNHQVDLQIQPDARLCSTPETVLWGYIAANLPPALSIKPGQIVEIEALSHQGLTTHQDPESFFGAHGIAAQDVLSDAKVVFAKVKRPKGASVHILTGPIYVEGAEPGDTLEIRVLDIRFRVPYGVNNTGPGKGVLPKLLKQQSAKLIRVDLERRVALFSEEIEIPLNPFMGIMAVSPPTSLGMVSSTPPGLGAAIWILSFSARDRRFIYPYSIQARNFSPVTGMRRKVMARSTEVPSRFR
jgi:acetamidase/formamidase